MTYLYFIFLLHFDEYQSFKMFTNFIMSNDIIRRFYCFKSDIQIYVEVFNLLLKEYEPEIYDLLINKSDIDLKDVVYYKWFFKLFSGYLSLDIVFIVWDFMFIQGIELIIFKIGLSIIEIYKDNLLKCLDETEILEIFKNNGNLIKKSQLIPILLKHPLKEEKLLQMINDRIYLN